MNHKYEVEVTVRLDFESTESLTQNEIDKIIQDKLQFENSVGHNSDFAESVKRYFWKIDNVSTWISFFRYKV